MTQKYIYVKDTSKESFTSSILIDNLLIKTCINYKLINYLHVSVHNKRRD